MSREAPTIPQILSKRVSPWKAGLLLTFIVAWWTEEELQGREIDLDDLIEAHWFSRSAAYRKLADFKKAFEPEGLENPHDLAELLPERTKTPIQTARLAI